MNTDSEYYNSLIAKYFSGELAGEELSRLSGWLESDPGNRELFRQYQATWELIEKHRIITMTDADQEWSRFNEKFRKPADVPLKESDAGKTMVKKGILVRMNVNRMSVAAAVMILLVAGFFLARYIASPSKITITAEATGRELILPDGSGVSLYAGSSITYPEQFEKEKRQVELQGEAYFTVTHDKSKPFIMASGNKRVEVLGTRFNVNTRAASGAMEVILTSGRVSVYFNKKPENSVVLAPGEKAVLDEAENNILKTANNDPNYMSWKTKVLVFENEPLSKVVSTLEHTYQASIVLKDPRLKDCRVTASFNDQSLQSVLLVLKETLGLRVAEHGGVTEISGEGCP